jgi:integral membrane protein
MKMLRFISILEGTSLLLLLFVAVPLKRLMDMPEIVSLIGPVHGGLFIAFNLLLVLSVSRFGVSAKHVLMGFIASLVPFGSYVFKAKILSKY